MKQEKGRNTCLLLSREQQKETEVMVIFNPGGNMKCVSVCVRRVQTPENPQISECMKVQPS